MNRLNSYTFSFLDIETTGFSSKLGDRICEIAIVRCKGDKVVDTFSSLLNPERILSLGAARINGLKDSDLKKAPRFIDVTKQIMSLIQDAVIVCHNVPFDIGFLNSEFGRINKHLPTLLTLDTLKIAREHFDFGSNGLQSIAQSLGIEVKEAHRALDDVFTTREILKHFFRELRSSEIKGAITQHYPSITKN